jgi:hypothetical protein
MLFLCHIKCPVPINQQPLEEYSILIKSKRIFWSLLIVLINTLFFIISQNLNLDFFLNFSI